MKKDNQSDAETLRQKAEELLKEKQIKADLELSESEMSGGKIWVESEPENLPAPPRQQTDGKAGGSTFYFTIAK